MNRLLELEVFSPVSLIEPESFFADVESVGFDLLGKDYQQQIRYGGGNTVSPRESGLTVEPPNKLKYYYLSRVAPNLGHNVLDLAIAASLVIEERRVPGVIGGIDIIQPMVELSGVDKDESFCETFHYIEKIKSVRYKDQTVLALGQLPGADRLKNMAILANELFDDQKLEMFEDPDSKKLMEGHEIAGFIPFARVKHVDTPMSKIDEAIEDLTINTLKKNVHVSIDPIRHTVGEN